MSSVASPVPPPALLCVGEALIDIVHRSGRPSAEHIGGSLLNVAAGTAALGVPTRLASWWGPDARGQRLAEAAAAAGVDVVAGSDGAARTSVAQAHLDAAGHARYDFDLSWSVPALPSDAVIGHLHTGSLAATVEPGGEQVLALVERLRPDATISYDPNARPAIMGSPEAVRDRVAQLIARSDVVKASDEDIAWLYPEAEPADVLAAWAGLGPALVVMTRGGDGALARLAHDETALVVDAPAVEVEGYNVNDLVVHQQDLEAVMNALWAGGAEAMTVQGERLSATSSVRCVGNVLLLHGRQYSPPYVIEVIGDPEQLQASLDSSPEVAVYRQYVEAVRLGWSVTVLDSVVMPPFGGSLTLNHARVAEEEA